MFTTLLYYGLPSMIAIGAVLGLAVFIAVCFRVVVPTNETHIVQSAKHTISFGKDQPSGNTYYAWPSWVPKIGIRVIKLPVSVISLKLESYAAYDKGRVPFAIDIMAFFRIEDPNTAAQRITSVQELERQLTGILQGASRSILAGADIQDILEKRAEFGHQFTEATTDQLKAWGVINVKTIELMDIHDVENSKVISNIMAMKQSLIDRESRVAVADNRRVAAEAEIAAKQIVDTRQVQAEQTVQMRKVEQERTVQVSQQEALQVVREAEAATMTKTMAVKQIEIVRKAEIDREQQIVLADQKKKTDVIHAEGEAAANVATAEGDKRQAILRGEAKKEQTILVATGDLEASLRNAQGVEANGKAKGEALKAEQMATVDPQITLAKEIGTNDGYQKYLLGLEQIKAGQVVGVAQAGAMSHADIKVIVNSGDATSGVRSAMDLLTSKGGTQLGAMVEGLAQTPVGQAILNKVGVHTNGASHDTDHVGG